MSSQLNDAEINNTAGLDRDESLQMTYSQAEATLKKYHIETDTKVNYTLGTDQEAVGSRHNFKCSPPAGTNVPLPSLLTPNAAIFPS
jgi:hypothetical protein